MDNHTKKFFMKMAYETAQNSPDPSTKVGCVITKDLRIDGGVYKAVLVSSGFNHHLNNSFPLGKDGDWVDTKYPYIIHAEADAIMNISSMSEGGNRIFSTLFPCNECAKLIVQAGIKHLYYCEDHYRDRDFTTAARKIFDAVGVTYKQVKIEGSWRIV